MILIKFVITNILLNVIFYFCGFNVSAQKQTDQLNTFRLHQNYPNPFNPSTKIKFTTSDFGFATLKVYDVLGNEIATLVNEEKSASSYAVEFNVTGLTSGIYVYRLKAGNFIESKKMDLIK